MRLALIPPLCRLDDCRLTDIQLVLPHMYKRSARYHDLMLELQPSPMQTIILDNGAAEPEGMVHGEELIKVMRGLGPDEMALPDILGYGDLTVDIADTFLARWEYDIRLWGKRLGFVAQGKTLDEAKTQ